MSTPLGLCPDPELELPRVPKGDSRVRSKGIVKHPGDPTQVEKDEDPTEERRASNSRRSRRRSSAQGSTSFK